MDTDLPYMQRCLELARTGLGSVAPNPMVGAVVVHNGKIIGEGYHEVYGQAHAEVNAIKSVADKSLLSESVLYVNLEPCDHFGKTPPCTALILEHHIPRVVIGTVDPFDAVAGKGISRLRNAGLDVKVGVLKNECNFLNRRFFTFHQHKRPYVILKWAQSHDGFIDKIRKPSDTVGPNWITSPDLRMLVHKWRSEEQSIIVGANTALKDNPCLNVRDWTGKSPLRLLIDPKLIVNESSHLFDKSINTIVFNETREMKSKNLEWVKLDFQKAVVPQVLDFLFTRGIQSMIVEGGRMVLDAFIGNGLWDEARVFIGDKYFEQGLEAPQIQSKGHENIHFGEEELRIFYNNHY